MKHVLHLSRIQHNGDTGADVQQGPVARILFRLRPCANLFYCLLLIHIPRFPAITEEEAGILASGHVRVLCSPVYIIKSEYLRECSASRVRPYMHQL